MLVPATPADVAQQEKAREILTRPTASASAVFYAAQALLGDGIRVYEPETVRLLLEKKHNLQISELHYEKLMCMITATLQPTFLWEVNAFENSAACCAGVPMLVDVVQELHPVHLAWAVTELLPFARMWHSEIQPDDTPEDLFDHEPRAYTALMLFKEGFVLAPPALSWAQASLDAWTRDPELRMRVERRWKQLVELKNDSQLAELELGDTDEDVQIARLVGCHVHVRERQRAYARELAELA